jgi:hypothetical protein
MPTAITVTATLTDPSSTALQGNSYLRFKLRGFTGFVPRVSGTSILPEIQVDALPNGSGVVSQTLWANSDITPANTFYTVELNNQGRITSSGNYIFNASTSLNTAAQLNAPPVPPGFLLVLQNNDVLNSSQSTLDLKSADGSVVITDLGAGKINLQAATGLQPENIIWLPGSSTTTDFINIGDFMTGADNGASVAFPAPTSTTNYAVSLTSNRWHGGLPMFYAGRNFTLKATALLTVADTSTQAAIGLFSSTAWITLGSGSPSTPAGSFVAFNVPNGGNTWHAITSGGGSTTDVNTGVAYSARHILEIDYTPASAVFKIDGVVVATISTNLPTTAGMGILWYSNHISGAAIQVLTTEYVSCAATIV